MEDMEERKPDEMPLEMQIELGFIIRKEDTFLRNSIELYDSRKNSENNQKGYLRRYEG